MGIFKTKQRTPEQIRRRFYISVGIVAVLLFFCLIPGKKKGGKTPAESVTETMDRQLQELCAAEYGEDSKWEALEKPHVFDLPTSEYETLQSLRMEYEFRENLNSDKDDTDRSTDALLLLIDSLEASFGEGKPKTVEHYVRHIIVTLADGSRMSGFQKTTKDLASSELTYMVLKQDMDESQKNNLENQLKTNN